MTDNRVDNNNTELKNHYLSKNENEKTPGF